MLCKSVGKWVGTESPDTVLSPVTFMLFPLLVTSPVSSSVCVFSVASSPPLPVLFLALEPANTRHIFIGFWVKIQSLVTIQVSLQVSLLPCLQSPHICPTVLVWLGSALATRLNWESEFLWLMWPVEHHIYSPPHDCPVRSGSSQDHSACPLRDPTCCYLSWSALWPSCLAQTHLPKCCTMFLFSPPLAICS